LSDSSLVDGGRISSSAYRYEHERHKPAAEKCCWNEGAFGQAPSRLIRHVWPDLRQQLRPEYGPYY